MSSLLLLSKWWLVGFREITFFLDKIIYKLATVSFQVFCYISEITLVDGKQIESLMSRIYVFIGIVMVFVLAYNLLNYIIDPDKVADKKAGAGTFIKDIVLALVIITATPTLFTKLYSFQNTIINSGVISHLLLGESYSETDENPGLAKVKSGANETVANIYTAFITPKSDDGTGYSALECDDDGKKDQAYCNAYKSAKLDGDISAFSEFVSNDADYEYWPLLSTAAGLALVFFMMSFCLNLGKRAGKLSLLALIAPIPALMEIIPGKEGTRKAWFDNLVKTYLEVFVFQAVVFLIIYLLTLIPGVVKGLFASFTGSEASVLIKAFVLVFLIFGLLEFAKEAPKMLMELLGIKSTGIISAGLKRGVTMGGITGGLLGSTIGRFSRNYTGTEGNIGPKLLSGLGGAGSGLIRNLWGARNVHNLKDAKNLRTNVNKDVIAARVRRDSYFQSHGQSLGGVLGGHVTDLRHGLSGAAAGYLGTTPPISNLARDDNAYREKLHREEVHKRIKAKYEETIKAKYKSDAQWAEYQNMINYAKTHGNKYTDYAGNTYDLSQLENSQRLREQNIVTHNEAFFQDAWGSIQSIVDANQGVKGVTNVHEDLSKFDINMHERMLDNIVGKNMKTGKDTGHGYTQELDNTLDIDKAFQARKQAEKRAKEARQETQKAAESASNKGKENKDN